MSDSGNAGTDRLAALHRAGVSIWLDDLSRRRLTTGGLAGLIRDRHVVGVTSNPTIFAAALANAADYDDQVRELAARNASVEQAVRDITVADVQQACDVFSGTFEATGGLDGRVSLEVDPRLAHDTDGTVEQAVELWKTVDRPNLMVKIPATEAGLPAITRTLAEGISVNVTLIFSLSRYRAVIEAFFAGLEAAKTNGHALSGIASVASFFVSRVDTEVDKRLDAIGTAEAAALRGTAAVANARLAYAAYQELFGSPRWAALAESGGKPQRPLWASTGTKDKAYPDTKYVDELVVTNTVNTMPEATLNATAEHGGDDAGTFPDAVTGTGAAAQQVFDGLQRAGIDLDDTFDVLEREGVDKFEKSWQELLDSVGEQLRAARG
jgi:transaldolase